jgi:signal transduction histidine kinase
MNDASSNILAENPDSEVAVRENARDCLLATVAHELRTPLMPIINSAQILQRRGIDPELVQASARIIERQARLLGRLVEDLLDVSHARLGAVHLKRERVSMADIVESTVQMMAAHFSDRGQRLQVAISADAMELHADPTRLCQALRNLLVNSAKFSGRGTLIRVRAARDHGDAVVVVSDEGVGIDASHLESIFTLYTQVGGRTASGDGGLGIGLYLARRFVEAHGGTLTATSKGMTRGSSFTIRVPCLGFSPEAAGFPQWGPGIRSDSADDRITFA